jgi:hypothetical protein
VSGGRRRQFAEEGRTFSRRRVARRRRPLVAWGCADGKSLNVFRVPIGHLGQVTAGAISIGGRHTRRLYGIRSLVIRFVI